MVVTEANHCVHMYRRYLHLVVERVFSSAVGHLCNKCSEGICAIYQIISVDALSLCSGK